MITTTPAAVRRLAIRNQRLDGPVTESLLETVRALGCLQLDPTAVVARNLAENAIRYAGPGTSFTLRVTREQEGSIVLSGHDDGMGVDAAALPRLFERFYRADRARASRGTGLGLAIVKHIVTQAGGTVEARGGRGSGLEVRCVFAPAA